jgi:integrase
MKGDFGEVDKAIERVNALRDWVGLPVKLHRFGGSLYLRGTFPPKELGEPWKQVRYPLQLKAALAMIPIARDKGRSIGLRLALNEFKWEDDTPSSEVAAIRSPISCEDWVEQFTIEHWENKPRTPDNESTYRTDYGVIFDRMLDGSLLALRGKPLTIKGLKQAVTTYSEPNSRSRRRWCLALGRLALMAGLDREPITAIVGNHQTVRPLNPREIPEPGEVIVAFAHLFDQSPLWARAFGMYATYGLRPSEIWNLDLTDFGNEYHEVLVMETKTDKERVTYPVPIEWWERFELAQFTPPPTKASTTKGRGSVPTRIFREKGIKIKAYDLRHFHAVQLLLAGVDAATAAKWMGHTPEMFQKVYLHWMNRSHHRQVFDRLL